MYTGDIDLMVCVAGVDNVAVENYLTRFLESLHGKCSLSAVTVYLVTRDAQPPSGNVLQKLGASGHELRTCPLPRYSNSMEDTAQVCNWMVDNCGSAPWFCVSHYDVVFEQDYIRYARFLMQDASMIGSHHDGVVMVKREAYQKCGVGFCTLVGFDVARNCHGEPFIVPHDSPACPDNRVGSLALDVGQLLELRMSTLGLRHAWTTKDSDSNDVGKSDMFTHLRNGSGHG